jgi:hypothetical protein
LIIRRETPHYILFTHITQEIFKDGRELAFHIRSPVRLTAKQFGNSKKYVDGMTMWIRITSENEKLQNRLLRRPDFPGLLGWDAPKKKFTPVAYLPHLSGL